MSAVEILAPGSQARTGTSNAFDANGFSTLRLDLSARADLGLEPWCRFYIETSRSSSGPWREIYSRYFVADHINPNYWPRSGSEPVSLGGFDRYVRCRWEARRQSETPDNAASGPNLSLYLGLAGDGQPNAV
jgi:hypothetical protein